MFKQSHRYVKKDGTKSVKTAELKSRTVNWFPIASAGVLGTIAFFNVGPMCDGGGHWKICLAYICITFKHHMGFW